MSPPGSQRFGKIAVPATVAAGAGGQFVLKLCYPNRTRRLPRAPLRQMRRRFPRRAVLRLPLLRGKGGVMASDIRLAVGDGAPGSAEVSHRTDLRPPDSVSLGTDPLMAIAIQTLSQAIEMLREDVEHERDRADRAERGVEEGRKRIDELQTSLADERRRIDSLYTELASARTAAMISGSEAAALRTQLALTDERRCPWWLRWFR